MVGFPLTVPQIPVVPEFEWRPEDRNQGTPIERRRRHFQQKNNLPNQVVRNGVGQLIHNGLSGDRVTEDREMKFVTS